MLNVLAPRPGWSYPTIKQAEYDSRRPRHAMTGPMLAQKYGSWKRACKAAYGLRPDGRTRGRSHHAWPTSAPRGEPRVRQYTREEAIRAVRACALELACRPSSSTYVRWSAAKQRLARVNSMSARVPSIGAVYRHFPGRGRDRWRGVINAAALTDAELREAFARRMTRRSRLEVPTTPEAVALGHLATHVDDLAIPGKLPEDSANSQGLELLNWGFSRVRRCRWGSCLRGLLTVDRATTGLRPDDLSAKVLRLKEDDRLHRELSSRLRATGAEIAPDSFYWVGVGRDVERAADQVDAPPTEGVGIAGIPTEARRPEIHLSPPAKRKRASRMLGVEHVDVEILDHVASVDVVERSPLAERDAEDAIGIRSPAGPSREPGVTVISRDHSQASQVVWCESFVASVLVRQGRDRGLAAVAG
jgi:hypothetical protein